MNLNQITVPVTDVEKAIAFYELLGLKIIVKALPHYARFECPAGHATFSVHLTEKLPSGDGVYIYFECEDLDTKVAYLKTHGIAFDLNLTDQSWLWREARLKDPFNNKIILYFAGENRLNPPWRLKD